VCHGILGQQPNLLPVTEQGTAKRDDALAGGHARGYLDRVAVGVADLNILRLGEQFPAAIAKL